MAYKIINGKVTKVGAPTKLFSAGFFFKAMDDDGFNFAFHSKNETIPGFMEQFINIVSEAKDRTLSEIKAGRLTVQEVMDQLTGNATHYGAIRSYNIAAFGTEIRPDEHDGSTSQIVFKKDGVVNHDLVMALTVICDDIWALTELGVIKQDEYNGTMFMYSH